MYLRLRKAAPAQSRFPRWVIGMDLSGMSFIIQDLEASNLGSSQFRDAESCSFESEETLDCHCLPAASLKASHNCVPTRTRSV